MLTMSPATMPWFVAPSVTAASPVRTPQRAWIAGPSDADRVHQLQPGPDGPFGVVLPGDRCSPDGHDGVADELLDGAAVALDHVGAEREVAGQDLADVLRVAFLGERREPDEVGEQDRDEATLGGGSVAGARRAWMGCAGAGRRGDSPAGRRERLAALPAEPLAGLVRGAAARAPEGERGTAGGAELASSPVIGAAGRAGHPAEGSGWR